MLKIITVPLAAAALMAMAAVPSPAQAGTEYPWCARYADNTVGATNCGFTSPAQCRLAVSGVGGGCYPNPAYVGSVPSSKHRRGSRR